MTATETPETVTTEAPLEEGGWYLVLLDGRGPRTLPLPASGSVVAGRDPAAFVVLDHESVSRRHAELTLGATPQVRDHDSKNGTRLDGEPLGATPRPMRPGSVLELGDVSVLLQRGARPRGPLPVAATSESPAMQRTLDAARLAATDDITVLLTGETGVGKEVLAERIHAWSSRSEEPFVRVHCAAISPTLFEAELFGHEKGAFTGATQSRAGLLESGDGGTIFIDEVGELDAATQVKLLRVLEDRRVRRVGGREEKTLDVRIVAATNRSLETEVAEGRFRGDLYFRLCGFRIEVPALRDRLDTLPRLAAGLLREIADERGEPASALTPDGLAALRAHRWPGNVRELKNVLRRAVLVSRGAPIGPSHLPLDEMRSRDAVFAGARAAPSVDPEQARIEAALEASGGNQTEAARRLGISRRTLINRLDEYGIARPRKR